MEVAVTDTAETPSLPAGFRGPVVCRRAVGTLTLSGCAADRADEGRKLTFASARPAELPESLSAATVSALDERHWRIASGSREWIVEATSLHVHRDIGKAFYRAIPPRPTPLAKRLLWRAVMALAGSRAGKRLLSWLRGR